MYVERNIDARSRNHCRHGKAISITYSECVFVALVIQLEKANAPCYIVICGLSDSTGFFTLSHKRHDIRKKVTEYKMCVSIFYTDFVIKHFPF
jgi:hypothetical protein